MATPDNDAARTLRRSRDAALRGDWQTYADTLADDVTLDDRRPGVSLSYTGRDAAVADARRAYRHLRIVDIDMVETRGERLALLVRRWRGDRDGEFEGNLLTVVELDGDGRIAAYILFDDEDRDAALAELESRYRTKPQRG